MFMKTAMKRTLSILVIFVLLLSSSSLGALFGLRGVVSAAEAEDEYKGDLPENQCINEGQDANKRELMNFLKVAYISTALKNGNDSSFYNGINNKYGRLGCTDLYTVKTATQYLDEAEITKEGYQIELPSDEYRAKLYGFSGVILSLGQRNSTLPRKRFIRLKDAVASYIPGETNPAADYDGCYVITGFEKSEAVAVRHKIGGTGLWQVAPDGPRQFDSEEKIDSFHLDYMARLMLIPQEQNLYDYLKVGNTYYRFNKVSKLYGVPASEINTNLLADVERYPYVIYDDSLLYNLYDSTIDTRLKIVKNNIQYEYREEGYLPDDEHMSNYTPYFTVQYSKMEISSVLSHNYDDDSLWIGLTDSHDDWPADVNTTSYHRIYDTKFFAPNAKYTITFNNFDDTLLKQYKNLPIGRILVGVYDGDTPTKTVNGIAQVFVGWKDSNGNVYAPDELPVVSGNETYTAVFEEPNPSISVTLSSSPTSDLNVGDTVTFTFTVTNTGNVSISDGTIESGLVDLSDKTFSLNPAEGHTITYTYSVTQADFDKGIIKDTVKASGTSVTGTVEDSDNVEITTAEAGAGLTVSATASPLSGVEVGDTVTVTVSVLNTGNVTITDGTLESNLADLSDKSFSLSPADEQTFIYTYEVTQADVDAGKIVDSISAFGKDPSGAEVTAEGNVTIEAVDASSVITVSLDVNQTYGVKETDILSFTVIVTNTGNVSLKDGTLISSLTDLSDKSFNLAPGESATFIYTYTVTEEDVIAESIDETVNVDATADRGDDPETVSATVKISTEKLLPVCITSSTKSWMYDGTIHTDESYTVTYGGESVASDSTGKVFTLPTGDKVTISATAEGVTIVNLDYNENNTFEYSIENASLYTDVTVVCGTLSIDANTTALVITSSTKEFPYDGETHKDEVYTVSFDGIAVEADSTGKVFTLPTGDTLTINATAAGVKDYSAEYSENNTFVYELENSTCYSSVTGNFGTLTIAPKEATLEWTDTEFPYDGESHIPTATVSNLIDGDECKVTVTGEKTEAGEDYVATATELSNPNYKLPEKNTTTFSIYGCVVIFKNEDGTVLSKQGVPFGTKPVYNGDEPTKEATAQYTYVFDGWTPEIVEVEAKETVYTATYQQKTRTYTVEPSELPEGVKLSITDKKTVDAGADVTFTITIEKGYDKGESFAVKVNGKAITPDENGTYKISGILEDVKITVSGVEKVSYSVAEGDKTKHVIGDKNVAKFVFKRNVNDAETFGKNTAILLDGKEMTDAQYTKSSGSLIVELKADFMDTLSVGEHILTVRFDDYDGDVKATLIIEKAADPAPTTGDSGNLTLWIVIGVVSLAAFVALFLLICKRRRDEEEEEI